MSAISDTADWRWRQAIGQLVPVEPEPDETASGNATVDRLAESVIHFDEHFWGADHDLEEWLVAPFLARGRGHMLYAVAKTGKSLLALYIAACAATGRPVLDQPAGPPIRVMYVDAEMTRADVRERLSDMGFGPDDDMSNLIYYSLPALSPLNSPGGGQELVDLATFHDVQLVVIDTISRLVNGEENSNDTSIGFARCCGTPMKAAGIAILRVDHAGKEAERGARGGSAKNDDVDVVWQLVPRDRGKFTLKATHRRMSWVPDHLDLDQTTEPLHYEICTDTWPAGTAAAAGLLDRLGVPPGDGKGKVRAAVQAAGEGMRNEVILAAQRYRRSTLRQTGQEPM